MWGIILERQRDCIFPFHFGSYLVPKQQGENCIKKKSDCGDAVQKNSNVAVYIVFHPMF